MKFASVSRVRHYNAIKMMAEVRDEMKQIIKIPLCHLISLKSWFTFRTMQTPLKQTAATQFRPMTSFAIEALRLVDCI